MIKEVIEKLEEAYALVDKGIAHPMEKFIEAKAYIKKSIKKFKQVEEKDVKAEQS